MVLRKGYGTSVLSIINNHYRYEIRKTNEYLKKRERYVNFIFKHLVVLPFIISIFFLLVKIYFNNDVVIVISLASLMISYVGVIFQYLVMLLVNRRDLMELFARPLSLIINNTIVTVRYDSLLYKALMYRSTQELKYIATRMKTERDTLNNKISLLIGGIDKLGVFPGLAAMFISINQFGNSGVSSWTQAVAYTSIILYILGFIFHNAIIRANEKIQLVDFIIEVKNNNVN